MKTKKLIDLLQKADPSGELEACVGNADIHFVERTPAYYDGSLQVLIRDENNPFYNIKGGKYVRSGSKVQIHTLSITDVICNETLDNKCVIDYSELGEDQAEATKKAHEELRDWYRDLDIENEKSYFLKWAKREAEKLTADTESIDNIVYSLFEFQKKVSPSDPLPAGGISLGHSYVSTREMQWSEKFEVVIQDGFLKIIDKK